MRVRIRKNANDDWFVEQKKWWSKWKYVESFYGDTAEKRAIEYARKLLNPVIIEITKEKQ
jgi:hypothetical protein